jgi:SpoVK/Ycf46/Vps4 family AAA+-type ATPase/intein/homing endonuclease
MPGQQLKGKSLSQQKVATYLKLAQDNEGLWKAVLVFLGSLFILGAFPFYPAPLIFFLALVCAGIAYKYPPAGTLASILLVFPAVAYQSPLLGWIFLLIIAITLFEMFESWAIISALEVLIFAPFAFGALPFFGWFSILGMVIASLHFGSKKSLMISIPSVLMILLLSSIWLVQNNAFMPLNLDVYSPGMPELMITKPPVEITDVPSGIAGAFGSLLDFSQISNVSNAIGTVFGNLMKILFADSGFIQLLTWAGVIYAITLISGQVRGRRSQLISSLALLAVLPIYFFISQIFGVQFYFELVLAVLATIAVIGILEQFNVSISREVEVSRSEKLKTFGKFGVQDMALGSGEKSLADIGNYEDVKQELRDAILMPFEKKEIAYTYGIKPPSGILMFGPPGTGKTMLMRALAHELKFGFYYIKSSDILSQWYGESLPYEERLLIQDKNKEIRLAEIGKIVEEKQEVKVLSFDACGNAVFSDITDWIKHNCTSPIYEVRTRTGRRIKVTDYHSLFALEGTRIQSVPTSKLVAGKSYIAIPKNVPIPERTIDSIDILNKLKDDDHGLLIKNAPKYLKDAIKKLGKERTAKILGCKTQYLNQLTKRNIGVGVKKFLKLMMDAGIEINPSRILIGTGSKRLPGAIKIDEKMATFIGLWIAEGSYNRQDTLRISTSQDELEKISKLCTALFGRITVYKKGKGRDIYIGSRPLYVLFKEILGLEHGANRKKMPELSFNLNRQNLAALLRGYFSGDGSIYENQKGVATVEAITVSNELADHILYLLLHFGIVGTVYERKEWNGTRSRRICFTGGKNLDKFKEIGFLDTKRNQRLDSTMRAVNWNRTEQIPITDALRDKICMSLPKWSNSATIGKDVLGDSEFADDLEFLEHIENDIYLDRVEEIKRVKDEKFVYDVSVDTHQNFVGGFGGIFAHNSEKNISEIFSIARHNAPCILFFDEIDSIGKKRTAYSADDVGPRVLSILLQEIDGFKGKTKPVLIMGATNVPNQLDPALLRPGRFDKIIYMHLPDKDGRKAVFKVHLSKLPIDGNIDLDELARKTERFSGADIKNVVDEAKRMAAKEATVSGVVVPISMDHLKQTIKKMKPSTGIAQLEEYEKFKLDFQRSTSVKEEEKERENIVKWEDVAGLDAVKQTLLETIELPLLREDLMKEYKIKPSKGILLFGPPGTGKTLIVKAASNELKASFQSLSGAEIMKLGYTQAVTVIKDTFNRARENAPSIVFIDEIETFVPARGAMAVSSEVVGQLLNEMDGLKELKGVVVMGATNKPALLDTAILRPGRFDKIFYIPPPDEKGREEIFKIHLGDFAKEIEFKEAVAQTDGFSGADIAGICQEAKMQAVRGKLSGKEFKIDEQTILKIIAGRRPSITKDMLVEYDRFKEEYGERK